LSEHQEFHLGVECLIEIMEMFLDIITTSVFCVSGEQYYFKDCLENASMIGPK